MLRKKGSEPLYRCINYCYCKEIAVDGWKDLADPHELSEIIAGLLAMSELHFYWKELAQEPRGRAPKNERQEKWRSRGLAEFSRIICMSNFIENNVHGTIPRPTRRAPLLLPYRVSWAGSRKLLNQSRAARLK
jgi:hypothetical protein